MLIAHWADPFGKDRLLIGIRISTVQLESVIFAAASQSASQLVSWPSP